MVRHTADRWLEMARDAKIQMDTGKDVHQRVVDLAGELFGDVYFDSKQNWSRIDRVMAISYPQELPMFLMIILSRFGERNADRMPSWPIFKSKLPVFEEIEDSEMRLDNI